MIRVFHEARAKHMTNRELRSAVEFIMKVDGVVITKSACTNWISLYCIIAGLAKTRLRVHDEDVQYSTEMPLSHIYLYATHLNHWSNITFGIPKCVPYDSEIRAFYGDDAVAEFNFDTLEYDGDGCQQPRITQFFGL